MTSTPSNMKTSRQFASTQTDQLPANDPLEKNRSTPLCRKLLITSMCIA